MEEATKEETKTVLKEAVMAGLIFNAAGEILVVNDPTTDLLLPAVSTPHNTDPKVKVKALLESVQELTGSRADFGDPIYDDYDSRGVQISVCMVFLENYEELTGVKWMPLTDIDQEDESNIMSTLHIHLINTLFNAQNLRMGNCYENLVTGEAFYVIYLMDDRNRNKKFALVESTMGFEPMVLPTDAFWGLTMKWVPHLRFMEVFQHLPETLADRAKHFFIRAHNKINHRYDGKPYSFHLSGVVDKFHKFKHLIPEKDHDRVEAELWGHDGMEDALLTYNDIKEAFDKDVAEGCYSMTNDKGRVRKDRAGKAYYDGLAVDKYGEFKKLCDRMANMENSMSNGHSMGKQYKKEFAGFEKSLRTHGDTYKEMWDELKELING